MKVNLIFTIVISYILSFPLLGILYILRTHNCLFSSWLDQRVNLLRGIWNFKFGQCLRRRLWTADCGPEVKCRLSVKCRLQTNSKTQAGGKMQSEILRPHSGKMRETTSRQQCGIRFFSWNPLSLRYPRYLSLSSGTGNQLDKGRIMIYSLFYRHYSFSTVFWVSSFYLSLNIVALYQFTVTCIEK